MFLSIIVPTFNNQLTINACLKAIQGTKLDHYELIVVDCGSVDDTADIARRYADKVIVVPSNSGRSLARTCGMKVAKGEVFVNVDSDVVVRPDTFSKIAEYFTLHKDVDAVTGLVSKEHPNNRFFTQYKNLYMHYIFKKAPDEVTFLYCSICAVRMTAMHSFVSEFALGEDTAMGQRLVREGRKIVLLKDLEVVHLKRYTFLSFLKNDFIIPLEWARIFIRYSGWKEFWQRRTGFAHSPKERILSIILSHSLVVVSALAVLGLASWLVVISMVIVWFGLNCSFVAFLAREKGILFGVLGVCVTLLDNLVMGTGILCGFVKCSLRFRALFFY